MGLAAREGCVRQVATLNRVTFGLVALGIALCALTALGAPALRTYGDNAFRTLALVSGGLAV